MGNFKEDIAQVKAFVFDVDGVFTDSTITPLPDGDFLRSYHAKDGYAVAAAIKAGYKVAVITGGRGKMLEHRFKMLGVTSLYSDITDKLPVLKDFMKEMSLEPREVAFMGDDVPDLEAMCHVGMPVCPADAASDILQISCYVSQYNGGQGCVRDLIEQAMRSRGLWAKNALGLNTTASV